MITSRSLSILIVFLLLCSSLWATDSEIISYVSYRQVNGNKLIQTDSLVYQINNAKGDDASMIFIFYSKNEKVKIESAWIEDLHGNIIRKLKNNEIEEKSAVSNYTIYQDRYIKYASLKHNEYPYRIVFYYQKTISDFTHIAYWPEFLKSNQDILSARLTVDVPTDEYPVRYRYKNIGEPIIKDTGKRTIYQWKTKYTAEKKQLQALYSETNRLYVEVVPLRFKYGIGGSLESWHTFGEWMYKLNGKSTILPATEKARIDRLLSGITTSREKARMLYQYLQKQTRYVNVSLKTGGLKSYPASYVAENKYGDCKALSTYMVAMLEHAGIKAYYTLINSGETIENETIDRHFPSLSEFNHVIVTLPLENDTVFLECTGKNIPFGYMGTFTQGREGFAIAQDTNFFVRIPVMQPEDVSCSSSMQIPVSETETLFDLKMNLRGEAFEMLNYYVHHGTKNETEDVIRSRMSSGSVDFQSLDISQADPEIPEMQVQAKANRQNCFKKYGKNIILANLSKPLPILEAPSERKQGLQFDFPLEQSDTVTYIVKGADHLLVNQNYDTHLESPFGMYSVKTEQNGNRFRIIKKMTIFRGFYPIEAYPEFYRFWSAVKAHENKNYYIELP